MNEHGFDLNKQVIAFSNGTNLQTEVLFGHHKLICDEPQEAGGDDLGPSPFELLQASLAVCTQMTLQLYARRKNWDLGKVTITISMEKKFNGSVEHILFNRKIHCVAILSSEQKSKLLEIANKCPVHKALSGQINISSEIIIN